MSYRDGATAVKAAMSVYDGIERECIRVVAEIDGGEVRLQDLNTGLREWGEVAAATLTGVLHQALATTGFDDVAATIQGPAYDATLQANNVLAAVQPVRDYLKANWPLEGAAPQTVLWSDADPLNAEIVQAVTSDAGFLAGLRPLCITLRDACNVANDGAFGKRAAQEVEQRRRSRR